MESNDQAIRERFIHEHNYNFSVIAPAGTGKTTAITRRIADIVAHQSIPLEKLIIVTYTNKAAEELRQRALLEIQKIGKNLNYCNKIFFGTIHAFADQLLRKYGYLINITSDFEIEKNEHSLWNDFLQSFEYKSFVPPIVGKFASRDALYSLVMNHYHRKITNFTIDAQNSLPLCLEPLLEFSAKNNTNIIYFQQNLRLWLKNPELPFPKPNTNSKEFIALYEHLLRSVTDECSQICAFYFNDLAQQFEQFRLHERRLTFHDLIKFSINLLNHETAKNLLCDFFVILDEAQDTDPQQFELLLNIATPSTFPNMDFFHNLPLPGHFCMVGDPQQSIYADRTDVVFYQKIHKTFTEIGTFEALHFSTTMRFGQNIARRVNQIFSHLLDGKNGQVHFSPIVSAIENSAPKEGNDTVFSHVHDWFCLNSTPFEDELSFLCHFFYEKNPQNFNISSWSEMAILCPRKNWLYEIDDAFSKMVNLPKLQIHSTTQTYSEFPEFSWPHALVTLLLDPQNHFEFSGILREIFGFPDAVIAHHFRFHDIKEIITIEQNFQNIRPQYMTLSPLQILDLLSHKFDLLARITAIYGNFRKEIQKELQFLATESICNTDFLSRLQKKSHEIYQSDRIDQEAIQLYTFHKAKGLEWPIVVIPFVRRKQIPAPHTFPDVVNQKIAINKRQYEEWTDPYAYKNNMQRLLYVALTRQKQQTIFISDGREIGTDSIAAILGNFSQNEEILRPSQANSSPG
ncbi:MAG: UvrD-helicase domain-containing protein [Puniceicoccales bacterium]|jgi:ATP-dependent exoDNAse (exonuclease V) beta subunit|nr:UvrD-helicase domain-containing protein [Puniceicoccales bacterium]